MGRRPLSETGPCRSAIATRRQRMITKEWLTDQISALNGELVIARRRREEADLKRISANDEYVVAKEAEETLNRLLQFRMDIMTCYFDEAREVAERGKGGKG
jgi:hypothetical protein